MPSSFHVKTLRPGVRYYEPSLLNTPEISFQRRRNGAKEKSSMPVKSILGASSIMTGTPIGSLLASPGIHTPADLEKLFAAPWRHFRWPSHAAASLEYDK